MSLSRREWVQRVLEVLRDPISNSIISLLSTGEYGVREIARILGRSESEISRRLSRMRSLGIVSYKWARIGGRNLKMYTLRLKELKIEFSPTGIRFSASTGAGREEVFTVRSADIPVVPYFVGREKELKMLASDKANIHVITGVPGIGKTTLAAEFAYRYSSGPVYWINLTELDYYEFLVKELALFLASIGYSGAVRYIVAGEASNPAIIREIISGINRTRTLLVVDDYYRVRDKRIREFIANIADGLSEGKLVIVSRGVPNEISASGNTQVIKLRRIEYQEAVELFRKIGVDTSSRDIAEIYIATGGHPGLLAIAAHEAKEKGIEEVLKLVAKGSIQRRFWDTIQGYTSPRERKTLLILCCFNESLPASMLEKITGEARLEQVLNTLVEKGLVVETNYTYRVVDLVKTLSLSAGVKVNCNTYYEALGKYYLREGSIKGFFRALDYFSKAGCEECIVEALYHRINNIEYKILDYVDVYEIILRSIENKFHNYELIKLLEYELGVVYLNKGLYEEALKRFRKTISLTGLKDPYLFIEATSKLLILADYGLVDYGEAIELAREAEKLLPRVSKELRPIAAFSIHANLVRLYASRREYDKAYREVLRELEAAKNHRDPLIYAIARVHLSIIKSMMHNYRESLEELLASYDVLLSLDVKALAGKVATVISQLYAKLGDYKSSIKYGREALNLYRMIYNDPDYCWGAIPVIVSSIIAGSTREAEELVVDCIHRCSNIVLGKSFSTSRMFQFLYSLIKIVEGKSTRAVVDSALLDYLSREVGREALEKLIELIKARGYREYAEKLREALEKVKESSS